MLLSSGVLVVGDVRIVGGGRLMPLKMIFSSRMMLSSIL